MPRVVHFEIHCDNPSRSMSFYERLFGWSFVKWEGQPYWLISEGAGKESIGGLFQRRGARPEPGSAVNAFVCTVDVADLNDSLQKVEKLGGRRAADRMPIRGVGWLAYVADLDENLLGLLEFDKDAA